MIIETRQITQLRPHPLNAEIYGDGCDQELRDLIKTHGLKPEYALTITGEGAYCGANVIISGHRRFNAAQMAGISTIPVIISSAIAELDVQELLILGNVGSRERTTEQKAREYTALKRIEAERAKERQGERNDLKKNIVANLPQCSSEGKSRDIAAEKVGMTPRTAEKAAQVVTVIDTAKATGHEAYALELTEILNTSVDGAYKEAKPIIQVQREVKRDITESSVLISHNELQRRIDEESKRRAKEQFDMLLAQKNKPHVSNNSGENEWYTPQDILDAAREVLGHIDLDPASSEQANKLVKATMFFAIADNGLIQVWRGKVWMNPPYEAGLIDKFCQKFKEHVESGDVTEGIVLVNNATETKWFKSLVDCATAIIFPERRIRFVSPDGKLGAPLQGQAILYAGQNGQKFLSVFASIGWGAIVA